MFWNRLVNKFKKKESVKVYIMENILIEAVGALEDYDISQIHNAYCVFATSNRELVRRAGAAISSILADYSMKDMIRLSEQFRMYTSMEWSVNWNRINLAEKKRWFASEEDYKYCLILGSFHPNGYYRERCTHDMAAYEDTLPYIILRMNDWVREIRICAYEQAKGRLESCSPTEVFLAFPALQKVKHSGRRTYTQLEDVEDLMIACINRDLSEVSPDHILKYEYFVRKEIYLFLLSEKVLDIWIINELIEREKNGFCQCVLINGVLRNYECSPEQLDCYLGNRYSYIRKRSLEYKYHMIGDCWPGLEQFLLDKSIGVRELAGFILNRHSQLDIYQFYTEHLKDSDPVPAITGLGDTGKKEACSLLYPLLEHGIPAINRHVLLSLGKCGGEEYSEVFWKYLLSEEVSVSKAAYISTRNNNIRHGAQRIYDEFIRTGHEHVRRYLLLLLIRERSWDRLPYILKLYVDPGFKEYQELVADGLGERSLYSRLTKEQSEEIKDLLAINKDFLPERLRKEILFELKYITSP